METTICSGCVHARPSISTGCISCNSKKSCVKVTVSKNSNICCFPVFFDPSCILSCTEKTTDPLSDTEIYNVISKESVTFMLRNMAIVTSKTENSILSLER